MHARFSTLRTRGAVPSATRCALTLILTPTLILTLTSVLTLDPTLIATQVRGSSLPAASTLAAQSGRGIKRNQPSGAGRARGGNAAKRASAGAGRGGAGQSGIASFMHPS